MRRIILLLAVSAMLALALVVSAPGAFAQTAGSANCATVVGDTENFVLTPSGVVNAHFTGHFHTCALEEPV